jgi:hypothetical protein
LLGGPTTSASCCSCCCERHGHVLPRASMSSRALALMLLILAGCPAPRSPVFSGPLTLGCPDLFSSLTAPRLLLLDRAIWISTGSVNIRHSPEPLYQAETLRCCELAVRSASQPLALGLIAASDLLRPPGSAWLTKGGLKVAGLLPGDGMAIFLICPTKTLTLS